VLGLRFQITTFDVALVQYFDAFDVLISQVAVPANLGTNTLVQFISGGSAIASVSIASQAGGNAFALIIDDFETLTAAAAVPEPKALLLLGPALMVFGAACRRRR
jgi:hypothetical protein